MEHYLEGSLLEGFTPREFTDLPEQMKRRLITLMARISEKSYRRGVQQAKAVEFVHGSVSDWRYDTLTQSKGIDTGVSMSVEDRFFEQNFAVRELGFAQPVRNLGRDWRIEWNQKRGHFHIEEEDGIPAGNRDYQKIGLVTGAFEDASKWASDWLESNPEAKAVYQSPFGDYEQAP